MCWVNQLKFVIRHSGVVVYRWWLHIRVSSCIAGGDFAFGCRRVSLAATSHSGVFMLSARLPHSRFGYRPHTTHLFFELNLNYFFLFFFMVSSFVSPLNWLFNRLLHIVCLVYQFKFVIRVSLYRWCWLHIRTSYSFFFFFYKLGFKFNLLIVTLNSYINFIAQLLSYKNK